MHIVLLSTLEETYGLASDDTTLRILWTVINHFTITIENSRNQVSVDITVPHHDFALASRINERRHAQ